jgi:hypothetical protein
MDVVIYEVGVVSNGIMSMPNFVKIGQLVQKLKGVIRTHIKHGDLINKPARNKRYFPGVFHRYYQFLYYLFLCTFKLLVKIEFYFTYIYR